MSGSKIYKLSTSSPIANLVMFFTERILSEENSGKVGDYIQSIQTGKTPPMNVPKYYSSNDIGWAKPSDIGKGKYLVDLPDKLSKVAVDENKVTIYQPGTLLIICIGAGVGRVALTDEVISSNQQITGILFDKNVIPEYAYYYFFCREAVFKQNASQTTLPIINQKGLKDLDFRCPHRELQKTFLNYLHYCEECLINEELPIEEGYELPDILFETAKKFFVIYYAQNNVLKELDQQQTYLQLLRQTILQEAVQGKLTKQNPTDEPATDLLKRIKTDKLSLIKAKKLKIEKEFSDLAQLELLYDLPDGWTSCRLGEVCYLITDGTHHTPTYVADGIPFISVKNLSQGILDFKDTKFISADQHNELIKRCNPEFGDVLLTKVGTTGIAKVIDDKRPFSIFVSVALLKFNKDLIYNKFLELLINSPLIKKQSKEGTEGIGNKNLVLRKIHSFLIPLPPLAEQQRIVSKVLQLQQQLRQLETQVQQSRQYAHQLLQSVLREAFEQKGKVHEMKEEQRAVADW